MRKICLVLFLIPLFANAQCNEKTKQKVDSLKASIPYPNFNIDDILYIAFINNPDVPTDKVTDLDIEVKKVLIVGMRLCNNIACPKFNNELSINGSLPIEWEYQFIDTAIKTSKCKDFSDFYSENRFSKTIAGAKQILKDRD